MDMYGNGTHTHKNGAASSTQANGRIGRAIDELDERLDRLADHRFGEQSADAASAVTDMTEINKAAKDRRPLRVQLADAKSTIARQVATLNKQAAEMEHFERHHDEHVAELYKMVENQRNKRDAAERNASELDNKVRIANEQINALKSAILSLAGGVKTQAL